MVHTMVHTIKHNSTTRAVVLYTLRFTNSENLFKSCQVVATEELFRADRVNELHREVTPYRVVVVPEVLEVKVSSSAEVWMFPDSPTITQILFP